MNIKEFELQKDKIIKIYEDLKNSEFIPAEILINGESQKIDKEQIEEFKKNLQEEQFIVSICGQIKSGKSTLLNALIFEDLILPSADTPETAKLTILKYGEEPKFNAIFYTKEDWKNIKKSEYWENIKESMNEIAELYGEIPTPEEYLDKILEKIDLSELKDYVGAKGKYTLFVKSVELYYPSEVLKEITIVDTPGTNDPDPARSAITAQWINRSDAVIYLTYAGRAFDKADKEFIENFLISVPREKILIGVTKIDTVNDYNTVMRNIEETAKDSLGKEWAKVLFENKKPYPLAPMFSLYKKLEEKIESEEIDLPKNIIEDIEDKLYDYPERNEKVEDIIKISNKLIEEFKNGIYKHVIEEKGKSILDSHNQKIISIFEYHKNSVENEIAKIRDEIKLYLKNTEEIEKAKQNLKNFQKNFFQYSKELNFLSRNLENSFRNITNKEIERILNSKEREIERFIKNNNIDYVIDNLRGELKMSLEETPELIENKIKEYLNSAVNHDLQDIKNKLISILESDAIELEFIFRQIDKLILDYGKIQETYKSILNQLNHDALETLRIKKWIFWTDKRKTKRNISDFIHDYFEEIKRKIGNNKELKNVWENFVKQPLEKFERIIVKNLEEYEEKLQEMEYKKENVKEHVNNLQEQIKQLEEKLDFINKKEIETLSSLKVA